MQASTKDHDTDIEMLRAVAKAEALRPLPAVPKNLEQWLHKQVKIQASPHSSWLDSVLVSSGRRQSLQLGAIGLLGGAILGGAGVHWLGKSKPENKNSTPAWVDAIAQYQSLYARETVTGTTQTPVQAQTVVNAFAASAEVTHFEIPDLSGLGLSFQRGQRLAYQGIPLLQLVYLAKEGLPLALCAMPAQRLEMKSEAQGTPPQIVSAYGMTSAYWLYGGLAWVMVAQISLEQVRTLSTDLQNLVSADSSRRK